MGIKTYEECNRELDAQRRLGPGNGSVFEVVDSTNEEQYFTIGIWPTLKAAIDALDECGNDPPGEDLDEDLRTVEIRERPLGVMDWSGIGRVVAKVGWAKSYDDDTFNEWRRVTPNVLAEQPKERP